MKKQASVAAFMSLRENKGVLGKEKECRVFLDSLFLSISPGREVGSRHLCMYVAFFFFFSLVVPSLTIHLFCSAPFGSLTLACAGSPVPVVVFFPLHYSAVCLDMCWKPSFVFFVFLFFFF